MTGRWHVMVSHERTPLRCVLGFHDWKPTGRVAHIRCGRGWWAFDWYRSIERCVRCSEVTDRRCDP